MRANMLVPGSVTTDPFTKIEAEVAHGCPCHPTLSSRELTTLELSKWSQEEKEKERKLLRGKAAQLAWQP